MWQEVQRLIAILVDVGVKELLVGTSEEAETNFDKERTLTPRFLVALSSLSSETLAGAEKECLRKGDFLQEG